MRRLVDKMLEQRLVSLASKSKARKLSQENTLVHGIGFPRFEKPPGYVLQWSERVVH
jgi:hypothetical protein